MRKQLLIPVSLYILLVLSGGTFTGISEVLAASTWTQLPTSGPTLEAAASAYDTTRQRGVLFGGYGPVNGFSADTWEWNGSAWTKINVSGPSARNQTPMAFDAARGKMVIQGGYYAGDTYRGDTWTYDGLSWTSMGTGGPGVRADQAMTYDSLRQRVILFGGSTIWHGGYNDTWVWNGGQWTLASSTGPSPRMYAGMAYDAARDRIVLFGGQPQFYTTNYPTDTWEWDGASWRQVATTGPSGRSMHRMVYDPIRQRVVLFGGAINVSSSSPQLLNDTWEWDGIQWTQFQVSGPSPRASYVAFYDSTRHSIILHGGWGSTGTLGDTWEYRSSPHTTIVADSVNEFSGTQGQNNWYYGYYNRTSDPDGIYSPASDFQLMTEFQNINTYFGSQIWSVNWANWGPGGYWTSLGKLGGHPNGLNQNSGRLPYVHWPIHRWVSEVAGPITISGTFKSLDCGNITGYIIVDGVQIWSQNVSCLAGVKYTVDTAVQIGATVDFAITPGQNDVDVNDSTEFTAVISAEQTPVVESLVAYYLFNGNANDESGNENHGTIYGATLIADRFGRPNRAYSFDGVDDYINVGSDASLKMKDGLTISAWINMASYSSPSPNYRYQNIISDHAPNEITEGPGKYLRFDYNKLQFLVGGIYGWGTGIYVEYPFDNGMLGQWQHVVGTYDRKMVRLYLNGVQVDSRPYTEQLTINSNPILIGHSGFGEYLHGIVDDVRIYNRALSATEIQALYSPINNPPTAHAGPDQTVNEGTLVTLDGSGSRDPESSPLTYQWTQLAGPSVALNLTDPVHPSFVAPPVAAGGTSMTFHLTVSDGTLTSDPDTVNITVKNVNHLPTANAGADQMKNEGSLVTLNGLASGDPDGDPLVYNWTQLSGPVTTLSDPSSATPSFTAPLVNFGGATLVFQLVVSDGLGGSATDEVAITIFNINDPPACGLAQASPALLWPPNHKLVPVGITGVSDPDNDQATMTVTSVTQDEAINGLGDGDTSPDAVIQGNRVLLRAERAGSGNGRVYEVTFSATDASGGSCVGSVTICVPHDRATSCVNDGQWHNSLQP